ncbi:alpha,alpha-trehalase nth1 [Vanrija albida]|uniref:Endonuclease III homolog n=1 Tax=Vanrija albida TaxID=181172 RepID=A0ABR3Q4B4_9TREE
MTGTLRASRSKADSRVSLISEVKPEPASGAFTSLRRSTRSTTREAEPASASSSKLGLSAYAYTAPSPRKRAKIEPKDEPLSPVKHAKAKAEDEDEPLVKVAKGEVAAAKKEKKQGQPLPARSKAHPEPARWYEQYQLIEKMRAGIDAPVDTMGCERPRTMEGLDPKTLRFHILISLMLSSQTKDAVTSQAVINLHEALPGGLSAESLAAAPEDTVANAINKVGFWRRKTEYIQAAAKRLLQRPGDDAGDVPQSIEELVELKGVGPKMGFLALQACWDINAGIGVDVHVHRITNRLKWHKPPTKTPEETRVNLESWLPPPLHKPVNPLLVGFGQTICLPVGPRCDICLLGQERICPSRQNVNPAGRKEVSYAFMEGDGGPKVEIGYEDAPIGPSDVGANGEAPPSVTDDALEEGVVKDEH